MVESDALSGDYTPAQVQWPLYFLVSSGVMFIAMVMTLGTIAPPGAILQGQGVCP